MTTETVVTASGVLERRTRLFTSRDLVAGALAGLIAGLAMGAAALLIGVAYDQGADPWAPVKSIAGLVYPAAVVAQPGFVAGPVLAGTAIHLIVAMVLGAVFAVLYRGVLRLPFQLGIPWLMGGVYGIAIWTLSLVLLPLISPVMANAGKPAFMVAHVVYGVVLGLAYEALHPREPRRDPVAPDRIAAVQSAAETTTPEGSEPVS
jgi:hypothetical protein